MRRRPTIAAASRLVYDWPAMHCAPPTDRRRPGGCRAVLLAIAIAALLWPATAAAQLGPGDLQRAHALTANSAGWVALRGVVREVVDASGLDLGVAPEEIADTLAVLLALEDGGGRLDSIVIGAARSAMTAHLARDPAINRAFAEQGLSLARARAISCLVFGQAPEERAAIASTLGLADSEIEFCPTAYQQFRDHWLGVAGPIRAVNSEAGEPATVELSPAGGAMASARAVLTAGQTLHEVAHFVTAALASPRELRIHAADCSREAAPAPENIEVRVCYEMVGAFAEGIERGIVAAR